MAPCFCNAVSNSACRWAWQNPHLTKKIADKERINSPVASPKKSRRTGKSRKRPARPHLSPTDQIKNLHRLLRSPSFTRWPLQVRFFSEDLHEFWCTWCERSSGEIRSDIDIIRDPSPPEPLPFTGRGVNGIQPLPGAEREDVFQKAVELLDVGYGGLKPWIRTSLELVETGSNYCSVCSQRIVGRGDTMLVCPRADCSATTHVVCLARKFLGGQEGNPVIPMSGPCPRCTAKLQWADLIKELSLRARGNREMATLLKERRVRKAKAKRLDRDLSSDILVENTDNADNEELEEGLDTAFARAGSVSEGSLDGHRLNLAELDDDMMSVTSANSGMSSGIESVNAVGGRSAPPQLEVVIEDSEWDDAEVLD